MKRLALLLLLLAALLSGCAALAEPEDLEEDWESYQQFLPEGPEPEAEEPEPEYPAAFSLPYHRDHPLDPLATGDEVQSAVEELLYEPLFRLDSRFQPVPVLCESWGWDETGLVCTLALREDAAFSDGSALTAQDVAATLRRAMESERYAYRLRNVSGVTASRSGEVVITLAAPNRALPALLDIPIVKQTTAGQRVPVGTGPYLLLSENGSEYLQARKDWWQKKAVPVETVPLVPAKDWDTALYLFNMRQVELLTVDPTDDPSLASGKAQAVEQPTAILQFIGFNTAGDRLFANSALRTLASQGIDRETLVNAQMARLAVAAQFPVSPLSPLYPVELEKAYSEDGTLAALRAAGQDTGETKELTLLVSEGDSFRSASARFIAEGLSQLDWDITVVERPWEEYLAALEAGEFDLYFGEVRLTADWDLAGMLGTDGPLNYGGYSNETTDILLGQALASEDQAEGIRRLCSHLQTVTPVAPVCFKSCFVLTHPAVAEGVSPAPSNVFCGLENWTVHLREEKEEADIEQEQ